MEDVVTYVMKYRSQHFEDDLEIHTEASCDHCKAYPIKGFRWQCSECPPSYDLCHRCYSQRNSFHAPVHSFRRMALDTPDEIYRKIGEFKALFDTFSESLDFIVKSIEEYLGQIAAFETKSEALVTVVKYFKRRMDGILTHIRHVEKRLCPRFLNGSLFQDTVRTIGDDIQQLNLSLLGSGASVKSAAQDLVIERALKDVSSENHFLYFKFGVWMHESMTFIPVMASATHAAWLSCQDATTEEGLFSAMNTLKSKVEEAFRVRDITLRLLSLDESEMNHLLQNVHAASCLYIGCYIGDTVKDRMFVSHRGADLKSDIVNVAEYSGWRDVVFIDILNLPKGESCRHFILESLIVSSSVIFLLTDKYSSSNWCKEEAIAWRAIVSVRRVLASENQNLKTVVYAEKSAQDTLSWWRLSIVDQDPVLCDSRSELVDSLVAAVQHDFPHAEYTRLDAMRPIGLYGGWTPGVLEMAQWNFGNGIQVGTPSAYAFLSVAIQAFDLLMAYKQAIGSSLIDICVLSGKEDSSELRNEIHQLESIVSEVGIKIWELAETRTKELRQERIYTDMGKEESNSGMATILQYLQSGTEYAVDIVTELASGVLCTDAAKIGKVRNHAQGCAYAFSLGFLGCALERLRDVCGLALGERKRLSDLAHGKDSNMDTGDLPFLVAVAIDNIADSRALLNIVEDVSNLMEFIGAVAWSKNEWMLINFALQEQYRLRRRALVPAGLETQKLIGTLGARDIVYMASPGPKGIFDAVIILMQLLNLSSRSVVIVQTKADEAGLEDMCGSIRLGELPHFTLNAQDDIYWMFSTYDEVLNKMEEFSKTLNRSYAEIAKTVKSLVFVQKISPVDLTLDIVKTALQSS